MKLFVKDLLKDHPVDSIFLVAEASTAPTKTGARMLRATLSDTSGKIAAVMWQFDEADTSRGCDVVKAGSVLRILGNTNLHNGNLQIVIDRACVTEYDARDIVKASEYNIDEMWDYIEQLSFRFENDHIGRVARKILLEDQSRVARFKKSPAATTFHHSFQGGLLEHTWQMCQIGEALLAFPFFNFLNRDLCLFGLLFHDYGKLFEYSQEMGFKQTVNGILVGHISKTCALIERACHECGVPERICEHLQHVILAHHGKLEYGSPVKMAIPEAAFVHYIDNLHGDVMGMVQIVKDNKMLGDEIIKHPITREKLISKSFNEVLKEIENAG